jgi:sodium/hydrogen antiporter
VDFALDGYDLALTLLGTAAAGAVLLPRLLANRHVSFPLPYIAFGAVVFGLAGRDIDPIASSEITERLTEFTVIVALMGVGLRIDRPFSWRGWAETWRLLAITMPVTIVAVALLGAWGLGLGLAGAILLGAVIAPTDPVLASDVQAGGPGEEEDQARFALTSEAGLNDGLAFPFTYLAIAVAGAGGLTWSVAGEWLAVPVLLKIAVGAAVGIAVGRAIAWLVFGRMVGDTDLAETTEGLVAIAATLLTYGIAEVAQGYGFIAVFVTALTIREYERGHEYHEVLHIFADQIERFAVAVVLILFGGALVSGLLGPLTWQMALVGVIVVLVVRPLAGLVGFIGSSAPRAERLVVSWFGIRGIGSLYYLAYGTNEASFDDEPAIWALVAFIVLFSAVLHGLTATKVMRRLTGIQRERA